MIGEYKITFNDFIISPYYRDLCFVVRDGISKRIKSVKGHITSEDYFGTLATVLDLTRQEMKKTEQDIKNIEYANRENYKRLRAIKNDLMFLQNNCKIVCKN